MKGDCSCRPVDVVQPPVHPTSEHYFGTRMIPLTKLVLLKKVRFWPFVVSVVDKIQYTEYRLPSPHR